MPVMIQIRNVPDELHRLLKSRAALAGRSLSDYALDELRKSLERPTRDELFARLDSRPVLDLAASPSDIIRRERDDARH